MNKKISIVTVICGIVLMTNISFANTKTVPVLLTVQPAILDVTVPMSLTVEVDDSGEVVTAKNAKIVNNSKGAVMVTDVAVSPKNAWSIAAFDKDFSEEAIGTKKFALRINNNETTDGGFTWSQGNLVIPGVGGVKQPELQINYDVKIPMQESSKSSENIADVMFTIGWYK